MRFRVHLRGRGRVQVPAIGMAAAEQLVEKELKRLWPECRVRIVGVARLGDEPRIVEEFEVRYRVEGTLEVAALTPREAPAAAFRRARGYLAESRYRRTEWENVGIVEDGG